MSRVWFTSDTHAFHKNICRGTSAWGESQGQSLRPFKDQYEMTEALISSINRHVGQDDVLWHLGDWSFGGIENIWNFRKRLHCKNIHLILGNHDHHIESHRELPNCHEEPADESNIVILDGPPLSNKRNNVYAHQLFSSVQHYKEVTYAKTKFILSHFAFRVWNKSHHGSIHLYGHSHGSLAQYKVPHLDLPARCMDVGVDTNSDLRPYSLEEILNIMKDREALLVDHHNRSTN